MKDDDYLHDPTAPEDPEVARLERLLRSERYVPGSFQPRPAARPRLGRRPVLVGVALAAAAAALVWLSVRRAPSTLSPRPVASEQAPVGSGPSLALIEGHGATVAGATPGATLPSKAWLESHEALVRLGLSVGTVDLSPDGALRVLVADPERQHLELARGRVAVRVSATPEAFVIDTPEARLVDLGCAYTLEYDPIVRAGAVTVTSGFVRVERGARRVVVPRGASLRFGRDGVESPVESDAPPALRAALTAFEKGAADVAPIVAAARAVDDHTLLDLAVRTSGAARAAVLARLVALVGLPAAVSPDTSLEGALGAWHAHLRTRRLERR